jgi:hypothetical protein
MKIEITQEFMCKGGREITYLIYKRGGRDFG